MSCYVCGGDSPVGIAFAELKGSPHACVKCVAAVILKKPFCSPEEFELAKSEEKKKATKKKAAK